jgi:MFS family permease
MSAAEELRRGWRIVLGSLCGIAFGVTGLFFYSTGIFLRPVASEFGWTRASGSMINLVAALTLAATAPFAGRIVDKVGARRVALLSSCQRPYVMALVAFPPPSPDFRNLAVIRLTFRAAAARD